MASHVQHAALLLSKKSQQADRRVEMPPGHALSERAQQNLSGVHAVPVDAAVLPRILRLAQQEEAKTRES